MASAPRGGDKSAAGDAGEQSDKLVSRIGPLEIDWPRSLGYFGGVALAVGLEVISPPVGLFIAAIPFLKMLNSSDAPAPSRFVGQVFEGAAQPVGGDAQGTIRLVTDAEGTSGPPVD